MLLFELIAIAAMHFGAGAFIVCIILLTILAVVVSASAPAYDEDDE